MRQQRKLGSDGPAVGPVGYGAMGLEGYYGATDEDSAVDEGCSLIDTADAYGNGHSEQLVGRAVASRRNEAFIATKFGIATIGQAGTFSFPPVFKFIDATLVVRDG